MRIICVVITARPSYSRIRNVLIELNKNKNIDLKIILSGSSIIDKYGDITEQVIKDNLNIHEKLYTLSEGSDLLNIPKTTAISILELSNSFSKLKPYAVITIADRYETIATSIAASFQNIPLIHIQGGEITGNIDEKVRHANTKLADIHFVSNGQAKDILLRLGEKEDRIFVTGCPSIDIAKKIKSSSFQSFKPFDKYGGVGKKIDTDKPFIVVLQHPHTIEFEKTKEHINNTLRALVKIDLPVIWFWPNVDAGSDNISKQLRVFRENNPNKDFYFFKNMESEDFLKLLLKSTCLVGNSSVGIRECSYLGVPVVNIGDRQKNRLKGNNVLNVTNDERLIITAIKKQLKIKKFKSDEIYGDGSSSKRISNLIAKIKMDINKQFVKNIIK